MTSIIPESDALLERATGGDRQASERLFTSHRDLLRKMVAARLDRRLVARIDPSDVVQEALAAAAEAFPKYLRERPIPFIAWLRQFAWERLVKLHRHHIHSQRHSIIREESLCAELPHDSVQELGRRLVSSGTRLARKSFDPSYASRCVSAFAPERFRPGDSDHAIRGAAGAAR